jgi:hypothetical protein
MLKTAVDASSFNALKLIWQGVESQPASPDPTAPWARVKMQHATGGQKSLANANGRSRYVRSGFVVVQLFNVGGKGLVSTDQMVAMILAAYEGKTTTGGIVFRNGRFQEVGQDGPWFQTNVFADFEYDEIL